MLGWPGPRKVDQPGKASYKLIGVSKKVTTFYPREHRTHQKPENCKDRRSSRTRPQEHYRQFIVSDGRTLSRRLPWPMTRRGLLTALWVSFAATTD